MKREMLSPDARSPRDHRRLALAAAAVVLALTVGARVALSGREPRSPRSAPSVHLTSGPTMTRYMQASDGAYRVSSELVTVTAVTPTPTATPTAIAP